MERSGMSALATFVEITLGTSGMHYTRLTLNESQRGAVANKNRSAAARGDPQASQNYCSRWTESCCNEMSRTKPGFSG
ncbi:MAG: hypothetical protein ACXVDZ_09920 [Bacteroidia bacterium]